MLQGRGKFYKELLEIQNSLNEQRFQSFCDSISLAPTAGFQPRQELLEVFSTEFQLRLLWGSRGAENSQSERYEKFNRVLTALSHKLEPAVCSSEL